MRKPETRIGKWRAALEASGSAELHELLKISRQHMLHVEEGIARPSEDLVERYSARVQKAPRAFWRAWNEQARETEARRKSRRRKILLTQKRGE